MAQLIGGIVAAAVVVYLVYLLVVYIILPGLAISIGLSLSAGALFGGGSAVKNYCLAFARNVKPERVK